MDQTAAAGPDPALTRAVSADLETIFQPAPTAPEGLRPGRVRSFAATAVAHRERRPAQVGAMVATALAGLALGAFLTKPDKPVAEPAPKAQQVARIDVPPVTTPPTAALTAAPVQAAAPVATTPAPAQVTQAKAERPKPARPAVRKAASDRERPAGRYPCNGLTRAAEARCAYPAVLAADRSLRAAYDRAVRAGVSRSTLVDYRSRWSSLRHRADDQPAKVIYGYRAMARDLDRLSRGSDT